MQYTSAVSLSLHKKLHIRLYKKHFIQKKQWCSSSVDTHCSHTAFEITCAWDGGRPLRIYTPKSASFPREMLNLRNWGWLRWRRDLQNTPGGTSWVTRLPTSRFPVSILLFRNAPGPMIDKNMEDKKKKNKKVFSVSSRNKAILASDLIQNG